MLAAGTRLGSFEILAPLGAGGMGEVYRARDERLQREVAIKVLPPQLAGDRDALARFEREAHAVAALSHPNILAIFELGREDGTVFAVSELLDGETLRAALAGGPLPVRRAVDHARQIATGLAAAHARGIVHRDLKPENVFVTRDGRVKILDFGLARPLAPPAPDAPTATVATDPGTVMGTVGYMSPEQVRALPVDARSDIFSFGAVLYEMVTGKRAFARETGAETMTAILREEPADVAASGREVPPALERIVHHCLEKSPEQRFQSASDVAFALEDLSGATGTRAALPVAAARPRRWAAIAAASLLTGLLLGMATMAVLRRPHPVEPVHVRTLTFSGRDGDPSASPDGRLVAFTSWRDGTSRIWVKQLVGGGEAPLTAGSDRNPRFAPDGANILFLRAEGKTQAVYRVALIGGEPRKLVDDAVEADWSPDGRRIVFTRERQVSGRPEGSLWTLDLSDGSTRALLHVADSLVCPRWSPDGATIVVARGPRLGNAPSWRLLAVDVQDGRARDVPGVAAGNWLGGLAWTGSEREVFFVRSAGVMGDLSGAGSRLMRAALTGGRLTTILWADGLAATNGSDVGVSAVDVLERGRVVFAQRLRRQNLREVALDPGGAPARSLTAGSSIDRQPVYAPDGRQVLFSSNRSGNLDLWMLDRTNGALRQLTDDAAQDWDPAFTPDGRHVLWSGDRGGHLEVWMADLDGGGARQVTHDGVDAENPTMTRDGRWIVYWSGNPQKYGAWRIHPDGSGAAQITGGNLINTDVSPDGRYVAFNAQDRREQRTTIRVFEVESGRQVPFAIEVPYHFGDATILWGRARWSADGHTLYYIGGDENGLSGVYAQAFAIGQDTIATRRKVAGFVPDYVTESLGISPDGSRLTISTAQEFATLQVAEGVPGAVPPERRP